ncbi:MAG: enoyl-CoA hydratase/isomerase family protein [Beijerinckiaceae bacterium]|nr:enoyl-CoA hydratase/isomerase family protein [Beijerinckiaceae bacterium]
MNSVVDLSLHDGVAVLTLNSPPVNALSAALRAGLDEGLKTAYADANAKAVVIICAGRTFIAGADISEFGKPPQFPMLGDVLDTMEASQKPIIAAIHGTALGGGFEVALTAHYRVAVPSAKLGLPEIKLGLLPGAGGTQRLPRLIGVKPALDAILSGTPFSARQALDWGAIDALAEEGKLLDAALDLARSIISDGKPLRRVKDMADKIAAARSNPSLFDAARKDYARKYRGFEAWKLALQSVENAVKLPFEEGIAAERDLFMQLVSSTQSKAQRHVFFAERQVSKIPDVPDDTPVLPIEKVGVLGAGTMGGGISMNFLNAGISVTIVETRQEALDRGLSTIRRNYENTAAKGRMSMADVEKRMSLLSGTLAFEALADCDLVIEAVFENMELKKEIFKKLDATVKQGAILASNTSYLDIDEIAASTRRPDHVLGLHFFSPANVMRLLEIVRGAKTAKPVLATAMQLAKKIGKVGVLVGVCHGFVGNRMLEQRQREANKLILEGAMPWDVDRVLYDFGLPMGPFAMSDLAGLDIGWSKEKSSSSTVREILCERDRRGQKTGRGFYDYDENRKATPSAEVEAIILDFARARGIERRVISDDEILERTIYPMINEGAKILEEGKAQRSSDIDIVWINGYGWPVYRGGPMFYGETVGLDKVLARLKDFEVRFGPQLKPAALLERLASEGKGFASA